MLKYALYFLITFSSLAQTSLFDTTPFSHQIATDLSNLMQSVHSPQWERLEDEFEIFGNSPIHTADIILFGETHELNRLRSSIYQAIQAQIKKDDVLFLEGAMLGHSCVQRMFYDFAEAQGGDYFSRYKRLFNYQDEVITLKILAQTLGAGV